MSNVKNLPASVRQRLLNKARETRRPYNEILHFYVIERFLYRISKSSYSDKFILKGALMFRAWGASSFRSTRDIDFLGFGSNEIGVVVHGFKQICAQEVEPDGLVFDKQTVQGERIKEGEDFAGVRIHLLVFLDKARIPLQIDIGFADVITPTSITLEYPTILQMPSPHIQGYPKETVVAEKFHALVFLGSINSRMKDFYDLWVLAVQFEFEGRKLQEAIINTFRQRNMSPPIETPVGLSNGFAVENQAQWQAFLKRTNIEAAPLSLMDVIQILNNFLLPPMQSSSGNHIFTSFWKPGGQWKDLLDEK